MNNVENQLVENLQSMDTVRTVCNHLKKSFDKAENGQSIYVCLDCGDVTTVFEDSNP